jgi:hypothetical protein
VQDKRIFSDKGASPTLSGSDGGGGRNPCGLLFHEKITAGFMAGQGSKAGGIGYQEEISPTLKSVLSGGNTVPSIVQTDTEGSPKAFSFDSLSSNSMKSSNPHSGCREVDIAKTIDTAYPDSSKNQGGIAIVAPFDTTQITSPQNASKVEYGAPCHTINANAHVPAVVIEAPPRSAAIACTPLLPEHYAQAEPVLTVPQDRVTK